jgi:predicted RNA binding protein YcfA (HicA-like mRNA interferase family)
MNGRIRGTKTMVKKGSDPFFTFYLKRLAPMVVIITIMNSKQIIKQLEADGWVLRGVRGSHHIFKHPIKPGHISVPHPKELGVGITYKLLKQAELN